MKSCWLKLVVLIPLAWWLTSCGMSELSQSLAPRSPEARADEPQTPAAQDANGIDFEKHIQPLFAKHCVDCHKAGKSESGYRLDLGDLAIKGGDRGAAVVPGKSGDSVLFQALIGNQLRPHMQRVASSLTVSRSPAPFESASAAPSFRASWSA